MARRDIQVIRDKPEYSLQGRRGKQLGPLSTPPEFGSNYPAPLETPSSEASFSSAFDTTFQGDDHFESQKVVTLNQYNFKDFIGRKEKALILFYDVNKSQSRGVKIQFSDAAEKSVNDKHGFAAVDCLNYGNLCERENVTKLPTFKLFSNGFEVSTMTYAQQFDSEQMQDLMNLTPILTGPRADNRAEMPISVAKKKKRRNVLRALSCFGGNIK